MAAMKCLFGYPMVLAYDDGRDEMLVWEPMAFDCCCHWFVRYIWSMGITGFTAHWFVRYIWSMGITGFTATF